MYDVIIVGKGPAGLSASLYTVRANLKTLIIGKNDSALGKAGKIENYFGFTGTISGQELLKASELQALRLGVKIIDEEVIAINYNDNYEIITTEGKYQSRSVLLATGQPQKKLSIEGIEKFEGMGVSYCTTCDGFFYRGLKVGILGNKDFAVHEAIELKAFTDDIIIFTDGHNLEISGSDKNIDGFKVNKKKITRIDGNESLEYVYFSDNTSERIDGLFIAQESASSVDFARKLGVITDGNSIVTDRDQKTNLDGFFAAGDCTGGFKQISTAVGQGAVAGRKIIEYLRKLSESDIKEDKII